MAPSFAHERPLQSIVQLVEILAEVRDMDMVSAGSTTFKREDLARGFEPDASFYIRHAEDVRGDAEIDLDNDPPPELAIETDITYPCITVVPYPLDV